jgi:uncharacterized RDD family membrane protein YckC
MLIDLSFAMSHYNISTTQNVDLEFQIASVGDRILAYLLDNLIQIFYVIIMVILLNAMNYLTDPSPWLLLFLLPNLTYSLLCEIFLNGQSFGKMIMKTRVVMQDGNELTIGSCFIRWIFRLVDFTLTNGLCALLTVVINGKGQRLGDLAAGTTVLKIDGGSKLEETLYERIPDDYKPKFPEVDQLNDGDVQTIKEVLLFAKSDKEYSKGPYHPMLIKAKSIVLKKMKIESELSPKQFLETVLKDYNYYHQ